MVVLSLYRSSDQSKLYTQKNSNNLFFSKPSFFKDKLHFFASFLYIFYLFTLIPFKIKKGVLKSTPPRCPSTGNTQAVLTITNFGELIWLIVA